MAESSSLIRETYPLIPPFSYALVATDPESKQTKYTVVEVPLSTKEKEILDMIKNILEEELDVDFNVLKNPEVARDYLRSKVIRIAKDYGLKLDEKTFDKINYHITRDFVGFGPIDAMLKDHNVEDISCDGVGIPVYIWHRKFESIQTNVKFEEENNLDAFIIKLAQRAGRHISVARPLLDAALPDGSRLQLTYGREVTQRGSTFTIRKFRSDPLTITDMIIFNTIDEDLAAFLWYILENRNSVVIAGGTAAGKTSLLKSLAMYIRPGMKIVSIEDTAELHLPHENWIPAVAREGYGGREADGSRRGEVSMYDLLRAALRQRPDYLFVGEVRGAEAYNLFQAMATGHTGMGTIHLIQTLNILLVLRKVRRGDKQVRRVIECTEIVGIDPVTTELITNKVFGWNAREDAFINYGRSYALEGIQEAQGLTEAQVFDELERRKTILRWMVKKKLAHFSQVSEVINSYYQSALETVDRAKRELKAI
jgi:flagellar protein FlaI